MESTFCWFKCHNVRKVPNGSVFFFFRDQWISLQAQGSVDIGCSLRQLQHKAKQAEFFTVVFLFSCRGNCLYVTMITQVKPINSSTDCSKENVDSEKLSFSSKWKEFASNTTLHGLRYVFQNSLSIPRRATWLVFLCAAASAYTYNSTTSLEKFMSRPIKTVVSQETPSGGLKFPAVTICNLNKLMKTKIDMTVHNKNFYKMGLNISGCSETRAVRGNLTCGQALLCAYHKYGYALVDNCNIKTREKIINVLNRTSGRVFDEEKFLTRYGHDLTGMIFLYCNFALEIECSAKDFVPTLTSIQLW